MKQVKFSELQTRYPKLFAALNEMFQDNNGGGVIPIWESSKSENEIQHFLDRELQRAELFLHQLTNEEYEAFTQCDEQYCEENLVKYDGYKNTQRIMEEFFDGDNCIFVLYNAFTKKER